jgi:signal transduction histidine kinase
MSIKKKLTLSQQIFLSMIALISFALLIVAILNVIQIQNETIAYNNDRLARKDRAVAKTIEATIIYEDNIKDSFLPIIQNLHYIHKLTINVYDLNGEFIMSSDTLLRNNKVITDDIPDNLLDSLTGSLVKKIEYEKGNFFGTYRMIYNNNKAYNLSSSIPIINDAPFCILDVVYDKSTKEDVLIKTKQQIKKFIKIYILLIIVSIAFAYFLLKQITSPLRSISRHLSRAKSEKINVPLRWTVKDEIGQLIEEYNKLMHELEKRTQALVKSEKEGAWKNMAKQIAHEIKNPLTPMRLSVQHIERSLQIKDGNFDTKLHQFSRSMISQIDTLARIANSFADFANVNKQKLEKVYIEKELLNIINLFNINSVRYKKNKDIDLSNLQIEIDKSHLTRIINNVVNNSLQAARKQVAIQVVIQINQVNKLNVEYFIIKISDNGTGISKSAQDKIFEPNFTTKNSGMGLGLAMIKKIIDDLNGFIEYQTQINIGTQFYIHIPIKLDSKI